MDLTQQKGLSTELHCQLDLINLGIQCLTPITEDSRYDIVAEVNGKFIKIQCKTASWSKKTAKDKVAFDISTYRVTINTKKATRHKYTSDEIDYFYTWFNGQGYLVSINEAKGLNFRFRYEYPSSNQHEGIHLAENYKIEEVLKAV